MASPTIGNTSSGKGAASPVNIMHNLNANSNRLREPRANLTSNLRTCKSIIPTNQSTTVTASIRNTGNINTNTTNEDHQDRPNRAAKNTPATDASATIAATKIRLFFLKPSIAPHPGHCHLTQIHARSHRRVHCTG